MSTTVTMPTDGLFPFVSVLTSSATAGRATAVIFSPVILGRAKRITINFPSNAGRWSHTGTDDVALSDPYLTIPSGWSAIFDMAIETSSKSLSRGTIYLASPDSSARIEIVVEGG